MFYIYIYIYIYVCIYKSIDRCVYYMDTLIKSLTDKQIIPIMIDRYDGLLPRKITDYQNGKK